ncbi:MAG: chromate transporter, partial [Armatimonadota bacterium]
LLAFGGGQAVLPLIERESVALRHWSTTPEFIAGVGFGYLIPGPVTTMAAFIGYMAGGLPGGLAATLGMFLAPTILAASAAAGVSRLAQNRWIKAFGAGAAPAVVGLLGATLWSVFQHAVTSWPLALIAILSLLLTARTAIQPLWLLLGGAAVGWGMSRIP